MAGPALFLNPHVALQFSLGYTYTRWYHQGRVHEIKTGVGLDIYLGKKSSK
jgi:hypothetical protein